MAFVCNYLPSVIIFNIFKYLSPSDRLRASATCKTWRECVLHASQWPHPSLTVDLSPKSRTTFHQLRRNKWCRKLRDSAHETQALKSFLHKCTRFLNQLVVTFDPNCSQSVNHLIDVIDILLANQNLNHNNNNLEDNHCVHNWRSLRSLTLNPINVTKNIENNNENNAKLCQSFQVLVQRLDQLIQRCESLQHISFGCLQPVLNHSNRLLQSLAKRHSHSLKCLHLSSVKADPDYYMVVDLPVQLLAPFTNLKHLSLDFDSVNNQMLSMLTTKTQLETFVINVHGIDEQHEGLSRSAWTQLVSSCPNLKVTVNLVHTDDSIQVLRDSLFDTDMPLAHFRSYFVGNTSDNTICYLVNLIANRHSRTLLSLTLVNSLKRFPRFGPSSVFTELQENPLVMLAWRSRQLQSLTVIGYEVCDSDLIAITRLRGSSLKELTFPMCCISLLYSPIDADEGYDEEYDTIHPDADPRLLHPQVPYYLDQVPHHIQAKVVEDIAEPLNRKWSPISLGEIPKAVINRFDDMQTTYLSTLLSDQTICGESRDSQTSAGPIARN